MGTPHYFVKILTGSKSYSMYKTVYQSAFTVQFPYTWSATCHKHL